MSLLAAVSARRGYFMASGAVIVLDQLTKVLAHALGQLPYATTSFIISLKVTWRGIPATYRARIARVNDTAGPRTWAGPPPPAASRLR